MAFIQKSVTDEHVFGDDLRELRELRGWTREQLTAATGIRPSAIAAFEEGAWETIGDPEYAERHVRLLVTALEGNVPFMLGKYRMALKNAKALKNETERLSFVRRVRRRELFAPTRYIATLLLLPLVVLIGWYVWRQGSNVTSPPFLEVRQPVDRAILDEPRAKVSGLTDPAASVTVNGKAAVVGSDGTFVLTVDVPRGTTRLDIVALRRYGGRNETVRYVTYAPMIGPLEPYVPIVESSTTTTSTTGSMSATATPTTPTKPRPKPKQPSAASSTTVR